MGGLLRSEAAFHPDSKGYRYQRTIYNDEWLRSHDVWLSHLPAEPRLVTHSSEAGPEWSRILWNRHTWKRVLEGSVPSGATA
jgi:hypothetical protein